MLWLLTYPLFLAATISHAVQSNSSYPLIISEDERHFALSDGSPFFWQADTAWALFHRFNLSEAEQYLDDRASKGFNVVLSVGLSQFGPNSPNRYGAIPFNNYDLDKPNESYWGHVDDVVEMAWKKGIRIAMVPAWGYYVHLSDNTAGDVNITLTAQNSYAFGRWFGTRYPDNPYVLVADTNPVYTNETTYKSAYAAGGIFPDFEYIDWSPIYDQLALGLQDGSSKGKKALITIHPTNIWFPGTPTALASSFFDNRDWLTFDACQSGHTDYAPDVPMYWWNARRAYEPISLMYGNTSKTRPVLDNEGHYEGRYNDGKAATPVVWNASDVRISTFQSVFAGAAGFTYGADMVMQGYIPSLFGPDGSGTPQPWDKALSLPGSFQVGNVRSLVTSRSAWPNLVPDSSMIRSTLLSNENHTIALRAKDNSGLLVYIPSGTPVDIDMSCLGSTFSTAWFDPIDGSSELFTFDGKRNGSIWTFVPPINSTHPDCVLVLGD